MRDNIDKNKERRIALLYWLLIKMIVGKINRIKANCRAKSVRLKKETTIYFQSSYLILKKYRLYAIVTFYHGNLRSKMLFTFERLRPRW